MTAAYVAQLETLLTAGELEAADAALRQAESRLGDGEELARLGQRLESLRFAREREERERPRFEFVDRERELKTLARAWERAAGGRRTVALVKGPAGMGKTRLGWQLAAAARAHGGGVVSARALASDPGVEMGLVAELAEALLSLPGAAGTSPGSTAFSGRYSRAAAPGSPVREHSPRPLPLPMPWPT